MKLCSKREDSHCNRIFAQGSRVRGVAMGRLLLLALIPTVLIPTAFILTVATEALASPTEVVQAVFQKSSGNTWRIDVTLRHADTGWDHYANVWVVETLDGKEIGRRVLVHPHETEQPFTRSLQMEIPAGVTRVRVRAGDKPNGMDSNSVVVDLTKRKGERFEVR